MRDPGRCLASASPCPRHAESSRASGSARYVYALARSLGLSGTVRNTGDGVLVEVEGSADATSTPSAAGWAARHRRWPWSTTSPGPTSRLVGGSGFTIASSTGTTGRTFVSPDVAICEDCLADLADPANRRFRHPFVTCTNCGPRFTIITGLPYDRPTTTMARLPAVRRLPERVRRPGRPPLPRADDLLPRLRADAAPRPTRRRRRRTDGGASPQARRLLADGGVLAVKGIGGYHLACDATERRRRGDPAQAQAARRQAVRGDGRATSGAPSGSSSLDRRGGGPARPASPTRSCWPRGEARRAVAAAEVAPGSRRPGRDARLHAAAPPAARAARGPARPGGPGDDERQPRRRTDRHRRRRGRSTGSAGLADAWLSHDRRIHVPCDDSVVRAVDEQRARRSAARAATRRCRSCCRSRSPRRWPSERDLKNTFCLAEGRLAWLSGHVGDMDDLATLTAFGDGGGSTCELLTGVAPDGSRPTGTRRTARAGGPSTHAGERPVVEVQHHHAHVASTMAEHGLGADDAGARHRLRRDRLRRRRRRLGRRVPGRVVRVVHDGWPTSPTSTCPAATPACGTRAGWRCRTCARPGSRGTSGSPRCGPAATTSCGLLDRSSSRRTACAPTSSMGRLFDAVASLAGVCHRAEYDAQAAMELEALTSARRRPGIRSSASTRTPAPGASTSRPSSREVVDDVLSAARPGLVAARFHRAVADLVVELAERQAATSGADPRSRSAAGCSSTPPHRGLRPAPDRRRVRGAPPPTVPPSDAGHRPGQVAVLAHSALSQPDRRLSPPEQESACA